MPNCCPVCANAGAATSRNSRKHADFFMAATIRRGFCSFNSSLITIGLLGNTMCAVLQTLSQLGRETARIVLHASCVVCNRELPWRARTASCCGDCWSSLPLISTAKCHSCAQPFAGEVGATRCLDCMADPLPVGWTEAWGHYRGALERVLHAFK